MTKEKYKEMLIQNIIDCGQSIIDNAEKIANDYEFTLENGIDIECRDINSHDYIPHIEVRTRFYPENSIKRYQ